MNNKPLKEAKSKKLTHSELSATIDALRKVATQEFKTDPSSQKEDLKTFKTDIGAVIKRYDSLIVSSQKHNVEGRASILNKELEKLTEKYTLKDKDIKGKPPEEVIKSVKVQASEFIKNAKESLSPNSLNTEGHSNNIKNMYKHMNSLAEQHGGQQHPIPKLDSKQNKQTKLHRQTGKIINGIIDLDLKKAAQEIGQKIANLPSKAGKKVASAARSISNFISK